MITAAVIGVVMLLAAAQVGVPADLELDYVHPGQACLVAGTALLTWALLNLFRSLTDAVPMLIGFLVIGEFGYAERDVLGVAGGSTLVAASCWLFRRNSRPKRRKA